MTLRVGINGFGRIGRMILRSIIEKNSFKISIEASSIQGWEKYVGPEGISLGMKSFGKSAPIKDLYEYFNLNSNTPSVISLSRQKLPFVTETFTKKNMSGLGAYEIKKNNPNPEITLIASGSEVQVAIEAFKKLKDLGINSKVVSMPCQELFNKQSKEYKEKTLGKNSVKISIEASSINGWEKYIGPKGASVGMKSFGKSAPINDLYEHFGLTSNRVVEIAKKILGK